MKNSAFNNLKISKEMLLNLNKIGYKEMTPIQKEALPFILKGKDIIAEAKTGSGKTAAFGIGLLQNLDIKKFKVQSLVLCPTRELADQIAKELRGIAKFAHNIKILTLCGGTAFGPQLGSLHHGAHIVIGTPGRVLKHLNKNSLNLDEIRTLVLDEADRMLDMGFIEDIQKAISYISNPRQTLLFSATYPEEAISLSSSIQQNAISIKTTSKEDANNVIERFYAVKNEDRLRVLVNIFSTYEPRSTIVFCNTKIQTDEIARQLQGKDIDALAIHGDLEQYDRDDVLAQFSNKSCRVLIATDVAARGLDIKELDCVINYDLPHSYESYIHRIGRTARAGKEGISFTLYEDEEKIQEYINTTRLFKKINSLKEKNNFSMPSENKTLVIEGGKKDKLSAGDILGALTKDTQIKGDMIGKININSKQSYVAIQFKKAKLAQEILSNGKIKGKSFSAWIL